MTYKAFWQPLTGTYPESEARWIGRLVFEKKYGLSYADLLLEREKLIDEQELQALQKRLLDGEPVQYVLGEADFGPRTFMVTPSVLIPRPETYELCQWVMESRLQNAQSILDIGTGSGCIAITLAKEFMQARVEAWDISAKALVIARQNAQRHQASITFKEHDIFHIPCDATHGQWDIIVSNPPYVCQNEAIEMAPWVLNHEPSTALFVPDNDPLLFYRQIGNYAAAALSENGRLFFEANPPYIGLLKSLLTSLGFNNVLTRDDLSGKTRFISACKQKK